jgi:branched-chain amino acid aminotransferase
MPVFFVEGRFIEPHEAPCIDARDRAVMFGDSTFATVRAVGGRPFAWNMHEIRLRAAAEFLGYGAPRENLFELVTEAVRRVDAEDVTVRITLTRGVGPLGLASIEGSPPGLFIAARETAFHPAARFLAGIATRVLDTRRVPSACLPARFKTGNYLATVLARRELGDLVEGIQLTVDGAVSSGTISNVFLVIGTELCTPHLDSDCRDGVTRALALELAPSFGLRAVERRIEVDELAGAREVFFTNTVMDALPVRALERTGRPTHHYDTAFVTARALRAALVARRTEALP